MAKILIVEDDTNLSEIYQARMEAEGYTVVSAADGESALAVAAKEKPDLIVSDVMMPKISGFEMLDILRNTPGLKDTPVIMLTALGQADDKGRADALGANRYLVKSQVTLEDIVNAAHAMLEGGTNPVTAPTTDPPAASSPADDSAASDDAAAAPAAATSPADSTAAAAPAKPAPTGPLPASKPAPAPLTPVAEPSTVNESGTASSSAAAPAADPPIVPVVAPAPTTSQPKPTATTPSTPPNSTPVAVEPAVAADSPTPAPASTASLDDKVVASTINKLLQKDPQAAPKSEPDAADDSAAYRQPGDRESSLKRVIAPLDGSAKPSFEELLAKEEAANPGSTTAEIADTYIDSSTPAQAANNDKKPVDPNSIAI